MSRLDPNALSVAWNAMMGLDQKDPRRHRLNSLYWIINDQGEEVLFRLNKVQDLLYSNLHEWNVVLKSRQHGITTFACLLALDLCISVPNMSTAIIAHNQEDAEQFFKRNVRHAFDRLPNELKLAIGSPDTKNTRELAFSNGSSIRVTTSGRSGTYQFVHVSELGKICAKWPDKANEIRTGTINTVHPGAWVIIEGTAEGKEGMFYEICTRALDMQRKGKSLTQLDYQFHFFPWFVNPINRLSPEDTLKVPIYDADRAYLDALDAKLTMHPQFGIEKLTQQQRAWYVTKKKDQGEFMLREHPSTVEECFQVSIEGAYYAPQMAQAYKEKRITRVPHTPGILVDTWWDIGVGDETAIWFTQNVGREIHVIRYFQASGEGIQFYKGLLDDYRDQYGYRYGIHGAPHDIAVREWGNNAKTRLAAADAVGIKFSTCPMLTLESGHQNVRNILSICWFDEEACTQAYQGKGGVTILVGLPCLEQYRKEWDDKRTRWKDTPLENFAIHGADAFRTLANLHKFLPMVAQIKASVVQEAWGVINQSKWNRGVTRSDSVTANRVARTVRKGIV